MQPILVDSSVWIDFITNVENRQTEILADLFVNENLVCICPIIIQEVLQGIIDDEDFYRVKNDLNTFDILLVEPVTAALEAASIYRQLRKKDITIRRSNDCLIAYYAIFHKARLLHRDRDFDYIAQHTDLELL